MDVTNRKPHKNGVLYATELGDIYKGRTAVHAIRDEWDSKCHRCGFAYQPECTEISCHKVCDNNGNISEEDMVFIKQ
jgi:hypothetical protein